MLNPLVDLPCACSEIILSDFGTTGDGMLAALQALAILKDKGEKASTVMNLFTPLPQLLKNVRFSGETPLGRDTVKEAIRKAEEKLSNDGRLVVRPSGTESLIRVMAEGDNKKMVEDIVDDLCALIEGEAAS